MFSFAMAEPRTSPLAALPSTLFHTALISGALWATSSAADVPTDPRPGPIDISFSSPVRTHTTQIDIPGAPAVPRIVIGDQIPDLPIVDLFHVATAPVDATKLIPGTPSTSWGDSVGGTSSAGTIYQESEVDDVPVLITAPAPRYPRVLAEAGIDGRVTVSFVIDTDGHVVPGSATSEQATHPAFVPAAEEAVYGSRFRPAHRRGEAVAVKVRQAVVFRH